MKKREDGYYRSKVTVGKDPNGKPIIKYIYAKTQKELARKKQEAIEYYITGDKSSGVKLFGEYVMDWFNIRKKPFIAERTQQIYRSLFNNHLLPAFGDRNLSAINSMDVQSFLNTLCIDHSQNYALSLRSLLSAVFECAVQDGYIRANPAKRTMVNGRDQQERHVFTQDERKRVESVCRTHRDGLTLALLYYTGMRSGELRALQWKHIDLKERTIKIEGSLKEPSGKKAYVGSTKTKSSVRTIPIAKPLYDLLISAPQGLPDTYVVRNIDNGNPVLHTSFERRFAELMYYAGMGEEVPDYKKSSKRWKYTTSISPHAFRHNMATMLWENNVDSFTAAKILGHSSINTTMDIYTHLSDKGLAESHTTLDKVFTPAPTTGGAKGV